MLLVVVLNVPVLVLILVPVKEWVVLLVNKVPMWMEGKNAVERSKIGFNDSDPNDVDYTRTNAGVAGGEMMNEGHNHSFD